MTDRIRVLHVDDNSEFADLVAAFLRRQDERLVVETATDAAEGLARLADGGVDCVVADYEMPGRNGVEFLEAVREDHPDLPFVLYTGKGSEEVASEAISAGATDYLQKASGTEQYELLANRIRNAVEQHRASRRAAEFDRIRTLTSDVNQALVRAESREAAERRVCEILSESEPYLFAWIGAIDPETDRVVPRASAGVDEGYLDETTVTADDSSTGRGPAGTALREGRIVVSQNVAEDPAFGPWRSGALERGYHAVAAVPLEHEEARYGELVVYADRPDAFDAAERDLLAGLGDDVAHALHSFDVRARLRSERDRRRALFENAPAPVCAGTLEADGVHRIARVNDAFEDVFGYEAADVVGRDIADVVVPDEGMERHEAFRERSVEGTPTVAEVRRLTAAGPRQFVLTIVPYGTDELPADGWYAWYTDLSEQRERERAIEDLHRTTDALMAAETAAAVAETTVEAVRDILDLPSNGVHLHEAGEGLVPVAWTDRTEAIVGDPPTIAPGEGVAGAAFEAGEPRVYDDLSTVPERFNPETAVRSEMVFPLGDHGVLLIGSPEPDAFDEADVSLAGMLADHATTALDRIEREAELVRRRKLFEAVLETSIDGILVVDEDREYVTWNQQFIDMWDMSEAAVGDVPEAVGLAEAVDQLEDPEAFIERVEYLYDHPDEESREELRLADGRVFDRYSAPVEAPDGTYFGRVWFFRDVTEPERHERELARQNERLERFASVVSHDLRSPLNVVEGRIELAREECASDHLDDAARAVDRSLALVEDLLSLARDGERPGDVETVDLAAAVADCWGTVETADATLETRTDLTLRANASRLKQLLENLFRNAVEHGSTGPRSDSHEDAVERGSTNPGSDADGGALEHSTTGRRADPRGDATRSGGVTVTVGDLDGGFFVADDGPGIPADERDRVFDVGYSTNEAGTGFGLGIVREIADAHGWGLRLTESDDGGTRFEVTGVETA